MKIKNLIIDSNIGSLTLVDTENKLQQEHRATASNILEMSRNDLYKRSDDSHIYRVGNAQGKFPTTLLLLMTLNTIGYGKESTQEIINEMKAKEDEIITIVKEKEGINPWFENEFSDFFFWNWNEDDFKELENEAPMQQFTYKEVVDFIFSGELICKRKEVDYYSNIRFDTLLESLNTKTLKYTLKREGKEDVELQILKDYTIRLLGESKDVELNSLYIDKLQSRGRLNLSFNELQGCRAYSNDLEYNLEMIEKVAVDKLGVSLEQIKEELIQDRDNKNGCFKFIDVEFPFEKDSSIFSDWSPKINVTETKVFDESQSHAVTFGATEAFLNYVGMDVHKLLRDSGGDWGDDSGTILSLSSFDINKSKIKDEKFKEKAQKLKKYILTNTNVTYNYEYFYGSGSDFYQEAHNLIDKSIQFDNLDEVQEFLDTVYSAYHDIYEVNDFEENCMYGNDLEEAMEDLDTYDVKETTKEFLKDKRVQNLLFGSYGFDEEDWHMLKNLLNFNYTPNLVNYGSSKYRSRHDDDFEFVV